MKSKSAKGTGVGSGKHGRHPKHKKSYENSAGEAWEFDFAPKYSDFEATYRLEGGPDWKLRRVKYKTYGGRFSAHPPLELGPFRTADEALAAAIGSDEEASEVMHRGFSGGFQEHTGRVSSGTVQASRHSELEAQLLEIMAYILAAMKRPGWSLGYRKGSPVQLRSVTAKANTTNQVAIMLPGWHSTRDWIRASEGVRDIIDAGMAKKGKIVPHKEGFSVQLFDLTPAFDKHFASMAILGTVAKANVASIEPGAKVSIEPGAKVYEPVLRETLRNEYLKIEESNSVRRNPKKGDLYDPREEQSRAITQAMYEAQVRKQLGVSYKTPFRDKHGRRLDEGLEAKVPFAMRTSVQTRTGRLVAGTQDPTAKAYRESAERFEDPDTALRNRQDYEETLGKQRKSGFYRVTPEQTRAGVRYFVWPLPPGRRLPLGFSSYGQAEAKTQELNRSANPLKTGKWWKPPTGIYSASELADWLPPSSAFKPKLSVGKKPAPEKRIVEKPIREKKPLPEPKTKKRVKKIKVDGKEAWQVVGTDRYFFSEAKALKAAG